MNTSSIMPKMKSDTRILASLALAGAAAWALPGIAAQTGQLPLLDSLDRGAWEVRFRDGGPTRRICLRDGGEFIQLRHPAPNCRRVVAERSRNHVTVQFTCRGDGYGRTTVRRETSSLVQLEGQGIARGRPFAFSAEARRVGACR